MDTHGDFSDGRVPEQVGGLPVPWARFIPTSPEAQQEMREQWFVVPATVLARLMMVAAHHHEEAHDDHDDDARAWVAYVVSDAMRAMIDNDRAGGLLAFMAFNGVDVDAPSLGLWPGWRQAYEQWWEVHELSHRGEKV